MVKKIEKINKPEPNFVPVNLVQAVPKVQPITQEFGNGDMNLLRDKINELIANS